MDDINKTQHYTTLAAQICGNLIQFIPKNAKLIEPFVGNGDMINLFPTNNWETYDISPSYNKALKQDTLINPPDYRNKWVITNPPYLAKNKAQDKAIFEKYLVDDLYKAAILSILNCEGGILIVPTNFFADERTEKVRKQFLQKFEILYINIFTQPIFQSTTYSVCSFAFKKAFSKEKQEVTVKIWPNEKEKIIYLEKKYGYRIGGELLGQISQIKPIFGRLTNINTPKYITNIKLYALDTREKKIRLEYDTAPYIGKSTDRTYATLTCDIPLNEQQQKSIIERFNNDFSSLREETFDLALTNYRDYNRKRVGFDFVYKMLTKITYEEYIKETKK